MSEDVWAEWLTRGRMRGATKGQQRRTLSSLEVVRDRVIETAALAAGQHVLDLGAGTGLLALAARRAVGPDGRVVAIDISPGALSTCLQHARRARSAVAPLSPVVGDGVALPFAGGSFDAVVARSVLMHISRKEAVIGEIFRVLRPGGTVCVFEALADVGLRENDVEEREVAEVVPEYPRVRRHAWDRAESPMLGFDERDLVRWFRAAGFREVSLVYREQHSDGARPVEHDEIARRLAVRPNPSARSHEEAARDLLGAEAQAYLDKLTDVLVARGRRRHHGLALVSATR